MLVIVYGEPSSGKNYYVDNFISKDKIVIDEAHNHDFKNYKFLNNKDYFLIVQNLNLLEKYVRDKADLFVHCEITYDDNLGVVRFVTKRVSDKYTNEVF